MRFGVNYRFGAAASPLRSSLATKIFSKDHGKPGFGRAFFFLPSMENDAMSVYEPIHYWGQAAPTRSAFMFPGGVVSYGDLHKAVNAAAVAIARAGFRSAGW